jgi:hypothetical protein
MVMLIIKDLTFGHRYYTVSPYPASPKEDLIPYRTQIVRFLAANSAAGNPGL